MEVRVILVFLILPGALTGVVQWQSGDSMCSTRCPESSKYVYEVGTSYEYRYEAETRTTMSGAADDTATITITATVLLESLGHCEMALRMIGVAIHRSQEQHMDKIVTADMMSRARRSLQDRPLRFAFHDGEVGELCPDPQEDLWALNIKRGVLTSFQNSMRQLDRDEHIREIDVTGHCTTHYKVTQKGWKSLTVNKVKDMLSCTSRYDYRTSLLSSPYQASDSLQSLPLMKSSHECEHEISQTDHILLSSSCHEVHVFRPFSKVNSGAFTEASQKLIFRSKSQGVSTQKEVVKKRKSLVFEHKQGLTKGESVFSDVISKLKEICEITKVDIRPQVPHIFGDLVHLLRNLDYSNLKDLDSQLQQKTICSDNGLKTRKFFHDALPMAATAAALRLISDLLTSGEVKDTQASFWVTSLAFLPNPSADMIAAVEPLLLSPTTRQDALLAISSLVNNYCQTSPSCMQDHQVQRVLDALTGVLGSDCKVNDNNFQQVLMTLRAIGNVGHSETVSLRLQPCFTRSDLPMDVRVAALDAYRRMPCSADRNDVMEIFLRHSEDSELRVAAYLAMMKCPSDRLLDQVRQALLEEQVNQVGSFVWTHLTNLLETESPHKQAIRDVLENELLQKEFSMDRRKFSRNYELSFFSEKFNLGGVYENNIIWSTNSFLPRSVMMNLTVDMFGHSVNLLEVGGRVQGLEHLLDIYFGPRSEDSAKDGGYGQTNLIKEEKLARTIKQFGQVKDDLRTQLYLRIFGNELAFGMMNGNDFKKLQEGKSKSFFDDLGNRLMKDGEVSITQSAMFMDTTVVIPTVVGLPLNLTINGSASIDLQASQKTDLKRMSAKNMAIELAATFQPSGAVELHSMMSVDAFVTLVGLKMTSRLHTSTFIKGRIELTRGQIFTVEIDTPRETLELFDFQSKFYIVHDSFEKEQKMITDNRKEKTTCTGKPLAKVLGVELCASLSFPNASMALNAPYFPFTGPTAVAITLHKHGEHTGYRVFAKQVQTTSAVISQISFDTPGSKVDRAISLGFVANLKDRTFEADLLSPWKKIGAKASLEDTKKMLKASASITVDMDKEFKILAQLEKDIKDRKDLLAKLKPSILVTSHNGNLLVVSGELDYRQNKMLKTNFTVEVKDLLKKPISLDYILTMRERQDKTRYKNNIKLTSEFASLKASTQALVGSSSGKGRPALLTLRSRADYNLHYWPTIKRNLINLDLKIHDRSTPALKKYGVNLNFDAKQTSDINLLLDGEVSHKKSLTELEVKIRHGKNIKLQADKDKELLVAGFVAHNIKDSGAAVGFEIKAIYPDKDMEYQVKGKHEHDKDDLEQYLTVRYAKGKSVDAHLRLAEEKKKRSATFDLSYPAGQSYPARDIKLNADLIEKSPTHHVLSALASLQKGEKNSLVVSVNRPTSNSVEISSELGIHGRLPSKLDLSGNYALRGMRGHGQLTAEGKTYSVDYTSDIQEEYVKFTMDVSHPERRIKCLLEGGRDAEEALKRGKVLVMWDADKDRNQQAGITVEFADDVGGKNINVGGLLEVFTPVEGYHHLKGELKFENSNRQVLTVAEIVMGSKQKQYSAKFLLKLPVRLKRFNTVVWLKTPHKLMQHVEVDIDHSFNDSSKLSTVLKGVFNKDFLDIGVSGVWKEDVILRLLEGSAFFKSSIPNAGNLLLSFNHRDFSGRYNTQAVLNANGDQYSASLDSNFHKVHWQITTDGTLTIRAPQLGYPVLLTWRHSNSLHELNSLVTLSLESRRQVQLEATGKANVVLKTYDGRLKLRGPWNNKGGDYTTELHVHYKQSEQTGYDASANLKLEQDMYMLKQSLKHTAASCDMSTRLTISKHPEYNFLYTASIRYDNFPYLAAMEIRMAEEPLLIANVEIENPKVGVFQSNSTLTLYLEKALEIVMVKAKHEKTSKNQWLTDGQLIYKAGKTILFDSILDFENYNRILKIKIDTPYEEVENIILECSCSGHLSNNFNAEGSMSVSPLFDTVSTKLVWINDYPKGSFRVDTPFKEMRYLEVKGESFKRGAKRHSSLTLDYDPQQIYTVNAIYSCDFPRDVDVVMNVTTPWEELPSLYTEFGFQYKEDEVNGKFKLIGPSTNFEELSTNFGHRRDSKSLSTQLVTVLSPTKTWSSRASLNWENEIDGTLSIQQTTQGDHPMQLTVSHRGHTWEDFRTLAGFRLNGDRLESELAYSNKDGHRGLFMLATPDPDIDFFKTTFFQISTQEKFEGRYSVQYGETSKPYELGLATTYSDYKVGFSTDLKSPHTEDCIIEIGFSGLPEVEAKLLGAYGTSNKIETLVKYKISKEIWDVGAEFGYLNNGSGRNIGLTFKREGPLDDLKCHSVGKFMGKEVSVDMQYTKGKKRTGRVDVRTNFKDFTELAASFDHTGDSEHFQTNVYLRYQNDKETKGTIDFERKNWKQVIMTTTFNLPFTEYENNKLTYKHTYRRNKLKAETILKMGLKQTVSGEMEFMDNSKLKVTVTGPFKDFKAFTATGTFDEKDKRMEGDATLMLLSQVEPITATYEVRTRMWPIMANIKANTPFEGWKSVEFTATHDGGMTDFTHINTLKADAIGLATSETTWAYSSPFAFDGSWVYSSSIKGAEKLKLSIKNTQTGNAYDTHIVAGWELLKEIVVDTSLQLIKDVSSEKKYRGSFSMKTPFKEVSNMNISFDHLHDSKRIHDIVMAMFNGKTYFDADFDYSADKRRVCNLDFRQPRAMEFLLGGTYTPSTLEGELKLNWDKQDPEMNIHLTGEYTDLTDQTGIDKITKMWVVHPTRVMGMEYLLKEADREYQTDFLLTWDKATGQTLSYVVNWTDRSSRYSSAYDAMVKIGVPMRSIQVEGMYSNTGRTQVTEGAVLWDADRDQNMKVGLKGQLDKKGNINKAQFGLDLPFFDKKYSLTTETSLKSGSTLLESRMEFSYSVDPQKLLVFSSRIEDLSYGTDATNYSLVLGITHPVTDVNIQMTSHIGTSPATGSAATKVAYLTAKREQKHLELSGHVDKLKKTAVVQLKSPMKDVSLEGELSGDRNYNLRLVSNDDGQRSQVTDVFINPETKTFELSYRYDKASPSSSLNLYAYMVNNKLLQAEVYHMKDGRRTSETLMTVRLNSSHVLHTKLNWRPRMPDDLQQYLSTQVTVFSYGSSEALRVAAESIGQEVGAKYHVIMQEIKEETGPILQHLQVEMSNLQTQLNTMQRDFRRFYQRNSLHIRDINNMASGTIETLVSGLQSLAVQYRQIYSQVQQDIAQAMKTLGQYPMAQKYTQLVSDMAAGLKNSRVVLEQALDEVSLQLAELSDITYRKYLAISRQIQRKLQGELFHWKRKDGSQFYRTRPLPFAPNKIPSVTDRSPVTEEKMKRNLEDSEGYTETLHQTPEFQDLARVYNTAHTSLQHLTNGQYRELAAAANDKLLSSLQALGLKEFYEQLLTQSRQLISDQFHDLVQRPEFQQIYVISSEVFQQGVWAYQYWQVEENMRLAVAQLLELAKDVALLEISRIKNAVVDLDKSRIIIFDPQSGELQFEIYLPVSLKSLTEPPDVRMTKYVNRIKSWVATYIPSSSHSLWTSINNYLPNFNMDTWIPPYTAYGYLMGDQHVVTFDRKHYSFAGRCSYILTRDMVEDRFTVVVNYNNRPRHPQVQSLVVLLRGVAIEVGRDSKVKVNNHDTELPYFLGPISVVRKQSMIHIQDGMALTVEIDNDNQIYGFALSGWYHGRTAGLLGTFDNEPFNDLTNSQNEIINDLEAFTNSWEVGQRYCRSRNLAEDGNFDRSSEDVQACERYLNGSSSYYSPCFTQVEAGQLLSVCVQYVKSGHNLLQAQCKAGQQYRYMCHRRGLTMTTAADCVNCQLPNGQMLTVGSSQQVKMAPPGDQKSADVLFVVEEAGCNSWAQQSLAAIATHLQQALQQRGFASNRFGLVSYSGNNSNEQQLVHTIEGQVFGEPSSFLKATENLRLIYPASPGNADQALREALKYPFRVGVAKLLVLMPCSACSGDMHTLAQVLKSYGFLLHVLNKQDFKVNKANNHSPVRVFGMDQSRVFTQKSAVRKSETIFDQLSKPTDACAQLALATNGSVFDVTHLTERVRIQEEFLESFAASSVLNAFPPNCQVCSCHDDGTGRGHTVCRLCDKDSWFWNHIPAWLQSPGHSVMGVFNHLHHQIISSLHLPAPQATLSA